MTLLRNIIAMLAAGALSLGVISGAMAQDEETEQGEIETSADLIIMQAACFVDLDSASGDFGTFMWDDDTDSFVAGEFSSSITVSGLLSDEANEEGCAVSISGTGLEHEGDESSVIPAGYIQVMVVGSDPEQTFSLEEGATLDGVGTGDEFMVIMTLDPTDLDPDNVSLGVHNGTVTFTAGPDPDAADPAPGD